MTVATLDSSTSTGGDDTRRQRRYFLIGATGVVGGVGLGFTAWPFVASWRPSAKARALGGPVTVRVDRIEPGAQITAAWRGKPVWVLRRTPEMLERLGRAHGRANLRDPDSEMRDQQPDYARNEYRSIRPELLVVVALCTHLGCIPKFRPELAPADLGDEWMGGYFCPCHGSRFDLAGRVVRGVPAPANLVVPPYRFLDGDTIEIGVGLRAVKS